MYGLIYVALFFFAAGNELRLFSCAKRHDHTLELQPSSASGLCATARPTRQAPQPRGSPAVEARAMFPTTPGAVGIIDVVSVTLTEFGPLRWWANH